MYCGNMHIPLPPSALPSPMGGQELRHTQSTPRPLCRRPCPQGRPCPQRADVPSPGSSVGGLALEHGAFAPRAPLQAARADLVWGFHLHRESGKNVLRYRDFN